MDSQEPSVQAQPEPSAPAAAPSPSAATDCHGKKRKYEEATYDEKRELVLYATANPHLKQVCLELRSAVPIGVPEANVS